MVRRPPAEIRISAQPRRDPGAAAGRDDRQRFRGSGPGRGARGGQQGSSQAGVARDRRFYEAWLKSLRSLDFVKLSRNAQIDYLYIRKTAEQQIAREGVALPENPPRETDDSGITGRARGRLGLVFDLQDELIPYTRALFWRMLRCARIIFSLEFHMGECTRSSASISS
jgi:hypothetical protein